MFKKQIRLSNISKLHIVTCKVFRVSYKTGLGWDDWIYCTLYIHTTRDYRQYSAIADLHAFQFNIANALGFSVFTSRILATDLKPSHWRFKSHMKSSLHRLIPFLPLFCNCQFRRLEFNSSAPRLISWQAGFPKLDYSSVLPNTSL
jgi:hypothetical protein